MSWYLATFSPNYYNNSTYSVVTMVVNRQNCHLLISSKMKPLIFEFYQVPAQLTSRLCQLLCQISEESINICDMNREDKKFTDGGSVRRQHLSTTVNIGTIIWCLGGQVFWKHFLSCTGNNQANLTSRFLKASITVSEAWQTFVLRPWAWEANVL
jgi:hypothetical protein